MSIAVVSSLHPFIAAHPYLFFVIVMTSLLQPIALAWIRASPRDPEPLT